MKQTLTICDGCGKKIPLTVLRDKPVRDADETIMEVEAALASLRAESKEGRDDKD